MINKATMGVVVLLATITGSAATVLAVNNLDFSKRAMEWQSENCTQKELDKTKAQSTSAICHVLSTSATNTQDISKIKTALSSTSSNTSFYTLMDRHSYVYPWYSSPEFASTMVPRDSSITNMTLVGNYSSTSKIVERGKLTVTLLVNGIEQPLITSLDNTRNEDILSNANVAVKAGDKVSLKLTKTDDLKITSDPYSMNGLDLNIALFAETGQ